MKNLVKFGIITLIANVASASNFPKSKLENETKSIGSLLDIKSTSKKEVKKTIKTSAKKEIFDSALEVVDFAPIEIASKETGIINTKWHASNHDKTTQIKIAVTISKDKKNKEALDVKVFERKKMKNNWSAPYNSVTSGNIIKNQIITKNKATSL